VRLVRVEDPTLHIEEVDLVDSTPVLDIKPYVPRLDDRAAERTDWFAENVHKVYQVRAIVMLPLRRYFLRRKIMITSPTTEADINNLLARDIFMYLPRELVI
jgi:hypothetical protein